MWEKQARERRTKTQERQTRKKRERESEGDAAATWTKSTPFSWILVRPEILWLRDKKFHKIAWSIQFWYRWTDIYFSFVCRAASCSSLKRHGWQRVREVGTSHLLLCRVNSALLAAIRKYNLSQWSYRWAENKKIKYMLNVARGRDRRNGRGRPACIVRKWFHTCGSTTCPHHPGQWQQRTQTVHRVHTCNFQCTPTEIHTWSLAPQPPFWPPPAPVQVCHYESTCAQTSKQMPPRILFQILYFERSCRLRLAQLTNAGRHVVTSLQKII